MTNQDNQNIKQVEEMVKFCTHRTDFCNYCKVKDRKAQKFAISKKEITEWC